MNKLQLKSVFLICFAMAGSSSSWASQNKGQCGGVVVVAQGYDNSFPGINRAIDNLNDRCQGGTLKNISCIPLDIMNADIQQNTVCAGICTQN